ncbi:hypothetical protein ACJJTC_010722, partial [Scirpophaga incertulas]
MAETSENTNNKVEQCELLKDDLVIGIKKELDILVKPEPLECIVCIARSFDTYDIYCTTTSGSGFTIHCFLNKYTSSGLGDGQMCPKYVCKNCLELINVFEQTEIEYIKLKETFESIISKNPLFELQSNSNLQPIRLDSVKNEMVHISNNSLGILEDLAGDSEDEPLAVTKKKRRRKPEKRKKKTITTIKRKTKSKIEFEDSWVCNMCGMQGESGGTAAETAHKMAVHGLVQEDTDNSLTDVKKEEISDGSQTFNNGFDSSPKFELEDFDDDDDNSSNYIPEEEIVKPKRKVGRPPKSKNSVIQKTRSKKEKVLHKCDQCEATYSSLIRLEQHKLKHECSKPPYICEVCGAHYKHKRACDIHIALHKGISDWKCEECNKLFPSKGALARHNNIHTGKLNYQCDLCGKSFIHTSSFKMHKLSHSGVKPHACDVCGLALMTRSHPQAAQARALRREAARVPRLREALLREVQPGGARQGARGGRGGGGPCPRRAGTCSAAPSAPTASRGGTCWSGTCPRSMVARWSDRRPLHATPCPSCSRRRLGGTQV